MNPYTELANLEESIRKLSYVIANQREALIGTRQHRAKLIKEYGAFVLPPIVELRRKYPRLYHTEMMVRDGERRLESMEVSMILKQKRRKTLMIDLGLREEDMP